MKTFYLHIGTPKTATTYLQFYFSQNREALLADGLYYLADQRGINGEGISVALGFWENHDTTTYVENLDWFRAEVRKAMASPARAVLLSSEVFCETLGDRLRLIKKLHKELKDCGVTRVVVVCYLRRQDLFVESRQAFDIARWGVAAPVREADLNAMVRYSDYYELLSDFRKVFRDIVVRPFEKSQMRNGDILDDILDVMGIVRNPACPLPAPEMHNVRLRGDLLEMVRLYNHSELGGGRANDFIVDRMLPQLFTPEQRGQGGGKRFLALTAAKRAQILKRYAASNRKVAIEFLGRKDGRLFHDSAQPAPAEPGRPLKLELDEITPLFMHMIGELFSHFESLRGRVKALEAANTQQQLAHLRQQLELANARCAEMERVTARRDDLDAVIARTGELESVAARRDEIDGLRARCERLEMVSARCDQLEREQRDLRWRMACGSLEGKKLIGWGTGAAFRADYFKKPARLAYVIDNDPAKWGRKVRGMRIEHPSRLEHECTADVVVVVYSAFYDAIAAQIGQWGPFTVIPSDVFAKYAVVAGPAKAKRTTKARPQADGRSLALAG